MFKAFNFISHLLGVHKEKQKMAKNIIFSVTNFLCVSSIILTFSRSFCERPLRKTAIHHVCTLYVSQEVILW